MLTEIWFYQLNDNTAQDAFILRLCAISNKRKRSLTIYTPNHHYAQWLDDAIWDSTPDQFLAHGLDQPDCPAPIQIVTQQLPTQGDIVLNLDPKPLTLSTLTDYQRLIEVVLPDTKEQSRERWKNYVQQGIKPELKMI